MMAKNKNSSEQSMTDLKFLDIFCRFEEVNQPLFEKAVGNIDDVLREAKLKTADVDDILLVGDSTRIPKIISLLQGRFPGKRLNKSCQRDDTVCTGLGKI